MYEALKKLNDLGQSYWLDSLSRTAIESGRLRERVEKEGLRGVTSNPAIFNKAISNSNDYDEQIERLVGQGRSVPEVYEALVVRDVQDACDVLRPVYNDTQGVDGFVSLEVSPHLAHDAQGTMQEARRLHRAVERPNCFIKIPGTVAGLKAIEEMLYEGIPVNITLLFSVERYEEVAHAYVRALERREEEGKPLTGVASVASFFLSRIDVLVDQLLGHRMKKEVPGESETCDPRDFLGRIAVANARMAYQRFKDVFTTGQWEKLSKSGACVQRPLWASTSTKNPDYSDVKYVEALIGDQTVNTMPEKTIEAFADHGTAERCTIEDGVDEARTLLRDLEVVGIRMQFVTWQLMNEGIQKFIDPYDALMEALEEKVRTAASP